MKRFLLPLLLLLMCLSLLSGCSGGLTPIIPPIIDPDPPGEPVYDGELTTLVVRLQREELAPLTRAAAMTDEQDAAYIRIEKKDPLNGCIVYRDYREELLPMGQPEVTLPYEVPADQGYQVNVHTYRGDKLLGIAAPEGVDAPAKAVSTATISLVAPSYQVKAPNALYSNGDLSQIRATEIPQSYWVNCRVLYRLTPWDHNPNYFRPYEDGISEIHSSSRVPAVTEPTKLYYQVAMGVAAELNNGDWSYAYLFFPDLSVDAELPHIWIYPDPSWTE